MIWRYSTCALPVFQAKEKLISSLQSGDGGGSASHDAALEEARAEKFHLLSQLQSSQQQLESLRTELQVKPALHFFLFPVKFDSFSSQDMEDRHSTEVDQLHLKLKEADENCRKEKRAHATTQEDLSKLQQVLPP